VAQGDNLLVFVLSGVFSIALVATGGVKVKVAAAMAVENTQIGGTRK
jgi:hypothetical protein